MFKQYYYSISSLANRNRINRVYGYYNVIEFIIYWLLHLNNPVKVYRHVKAYYRVVILPAFFQTWRGYLKYKKENYGSIN